MSKIKAAFGLNGIIGILWIVIGVLFLLYQPLITGIPLDLGFSLIGLLILIIGILNVGKVIGVLGNE